MNLDILKDTPPWDWPRDVGELLLNVLHDAHAEESDRLLAAEMAGDSTAINEELVEALMSVLRDADASQQLRSKAAISLGPVLELAYMDGFDELSDVPISESTFDRIQASLRGIYMDTEVPKGVRRRILEASVRAPQDWQRD